MHRKQRMIPWGHIAGAVTLGLAVAGVLLLIIGMSPAAA